MVRRSNTRENNQIRIIIIKVLLAASRSNRVISLVESSRVTSPLFLRSLVDILTSARCRSLSQASTWQLFGNTPSGRSRAKRGSFFFRFLFS